MRQGHSTNRHFLAFRIAPDEFGCNRAEDRLAHDHALGFASLDLDRFSPLVRIQPLAIDSVLLWMRRIGVKDKDIRLIGAESGQSPGNLLVESDQNDGTARHPHSADVEATALDVKFVEKAGIPHGRLRIAHQHRRARRRLLSAHDPGMAEFRIGILGSARLVGRQTYIAHPGVDLPDPLLRDVFSAYNRGFIIYKDAGGSPSRRRRFQRGRVTQSVLAKELRKMPPGQNAVGRFPGFTPKSDLGE